MEFELVIPNTQLFPEELGKFKKSLPTPKTVEKLENLKPIIKGANRRKIILDYEDAKLQGYYIQEWEDETYRGRTYIPVKDLDN